MSGMHAMAVDEALQCSLDILLMSIYYTNLKTKLNLLNLDKDMLGICDFFRTAVFECHR